MDVKDYLSRHWQTSQPQLNDKVSEIIKLAGGANNENITFYREMLWSLIRVIQEDTDRWDAKIITHTLRELERSFTQLRQYKRRRKVTVYGSARTPKDAPEYQLAFSLGKLLADNDFMAITGAGDGVMAAAHEGAGPDNSLGFNITLPFEQDVNPTIKGSEGLLHFKFFFTRKLFFVKEADALVLFPGGYGTQDETFELLTLVQTGKSPIVPIIMVDVPGGNYWQSWRNFINEAVLKNGYVSDYDISFLDYTTDPNEIIRIIRRFYNNFHSTRWVKNKLHLRMNRKLPKDAVKQINQDFADICVKGKFSYVTLQKEEQDEPELAELARLAFQYNAKDYGRLRQLVDVINQY